MALFVHISICRSYKNINSERIERKVEETYRGCMEGHDVSHTQEPLVARRDSPTPIIETCNRFQHPALPRAGLFGN